MRRTLVASLAACTVQAAACEHPLSLRDSGADVQLQLEANAPASFIPVLQKSDRARFAFTRDGVTVDTIVPVRHGEGVSGTRVTMPALPGTGSLTVRAEALVALAALFRGEAVIHDILAGPATVTLSPVADRMSVQGPHEFAALGLGLQLTSEVYFVTGDVMEGAKADWISLDPSVVDVASGDLAMPRSNGGTRLVATYDSLSISVPFSVRQVPRLLSGVGPADTLIAVGEAFQMRAFGEDLNGFPLLPGAAIAWEADGVVSVDTLGVVTAVSQGSGQIHAVLGSIRQIANITVVAAATPHRRSLDPQSLRVLRAHRRRSGRPPQPGG